jgi:uncharacterized membrane-anchored protein YhcB (DUF1043 family)
MELIVWFFGAIAALTGVYINLKLEIAVLKNENKNLKEQFDNFKNKTESNESELKKMLAEFREEFHQLITELREFKAKVSNNRNKADLK